MGAVIGQVLLALTANSFGLGSVFIALGAFWRIGAVAGGLWWRYGTEARGVNLEKLVERSPVSVS